LTIDGSHDNLIMLGVRYYLSPSPLLS